MSLLDITKEVSIRCEDCAEVVVFMRHDWREGADYEILVQDSYCDSGMGGILGRFRRAWHAFFGKPVYRTGVYIEDGARVKKFLLDCLNLVEEGSNDCRGD